MAGLQVAVRSTIPPMTVDAIPENILPYTNLSNLLSKADWEKLCLTTARAANYRYASCNLEIPLHYMLTCNHKPKTARLWQSRKHPNPCVMCVLRFAAMVFSTCPVT